MQTLTVIDLNIIIRNFSLQLHNKSTSLLVWVSEQWSLIRSNWLWRKNNHVSYWNDTAGKQTGEREFSISRC
jgi:hypothetical protein